MHLLLPTYFWTNELLHVEAISIHVLKLILVEVFHGDSVLHELTLGSHRAVVYKPLHSLVTHVLQLRLLEEFRVCLTDQARIRLDDWMAVKHSLGLLWNLGSVRSMQFVVVGSVVCSYASSDGQGWLCSTVAIAVCLVIRVAVDFEVVALYDTLVFFDSLFGLHIFKNGEKHLASH